jgi:uncharacterized protein
VSHNLEIQLANETFILLPQKAMFRPALAQLILSDVHLGKTTHFRKSGIPLPQTAYLKDIDKLHFLLNRWRPKSVLLLGDLFHSDYNKEWLWFKSFLLEYPVVDFFLVEGNHDILDNAYYSAANLLKAELIEDDSFIFSHQPLNNPQKLNICGHIHPGVQIGGFAKQYEKLSCFYHKRNHFILPAFGYLTGLHILEKEEGCNYYLVTESRVLPF